MIPIMIDKKISYYVAYFDQDYYSDDEINEIYTNGVLKTKNDATLITDIQGRTSKSKEKKTNLMTISFDYNKSDNKIEADIREIHKQQLLDIFSRLRFIKLYEECLENVSFGIYVERMLELFPEEEIKDKCIIARKNETELQKVLNILKDEKIVTEDKKITDILKQGNIEGLEKFIIRNYTKEKPKFKNIKKTQKTL